MHPTIYLFIQLSIYLSNYISIHQTIYLFIQLSIYSSNYLSIHPIIYLFIQLSIYASNYLSIIQLFIHKLTDRTREIQRRVVIHSIIINPVIIKVFLPALSMRTRDTKVMATFMAPMPRVAL